LTKLIVQNRKKLPNDFEVVEFVEPEEIARIQGEKNIPAPLSLTWTWEYGSELARLRELYEKGKRGNWNAETDLDWECPVSKDEWLINPQASMLANVCKLMGKDEATQKAAAFDEMNHALSQLLHGEQAALQLCGQLTNLCPTTDEKWYAANQVFDEARHVEALSKFIARKMDCVYPINPTLKILLDELLTVESYQMKCLGMQTLFEGMAVGIFDAFRTESRNPLFTDMLHRIEQDEARHAAFGILTMRRTVEQASSREREEMEDWAFAVLEALNANQQLDMLHTFAEKYDFDPESIVQMSQGMENWAELNSEVFMHTVVPNLARLGLITERTAGRWRELGMLSDIRQGARSALPLTD
jgi:hypothetical protein